MKKILLYFSAFIFICFILPAILTKQKLSNTANEEENAKEKQTIEKQEEKEYKSNKYGKIKLLHKNTEEVEEIGLDEYLCNVVSAEMPADYEIEALKAQAIVARTYTMYKIFHKKHENADICDDSTCCQAWISKQERLEKWEEEKRENNWEKIKKCVEQSKEKIITYNNEPINAFFHANSGGITETPVNVWGGEEYPYLKVVETSGEEGYKQYASEVEFSNEDIINKLKTQYENISIDFENENDIKIIEYTNSNRVKTIKFGNYNISGVEIRKLFGLKSTNFEIQKTKDKIKFLVKGYGHGVGMSQTGANTLAKQGKTSEEIIYHFYSNVEIKQINDL